MNLPNHDPLLPIDGQNPDGCYTKKADWIFDNVEKGLNEFLKDSDNWKMVEETLEEGVNPSFMNVYERAESMIYSGGSISGKFDNFMEGLYDEQHA